jgi:acyl carrier protein
MPSPTEAESASRLNTVMQIIQQAGKLESLDSAEDFYEAGVSSLASLTLLLELEDKFEVSIPDDRFVECRTAEAVSNLISELMS